jgi:hypothetical protein
MAINNDGITFNMTEHIDMLNEKTVGGGGYAIPKEYIVQKYLKERINPEIPTATILAALDTRIFEDKAMASAQALMGGPQKSVLEETITETETAMAPRMPQGINQGQPSPMPGQMPRQMAGLQRPPMPGRVPPQQRTGTGIGKMMAAAGGYVPNFADGGIIGYKERGFVNRYDPDARPFTSPLNMRQPYRNSLQEQAREKYLNVESIEDKLTQLKTEPNSLENINLEKELKRQLQITEGTPVTGGGYEKGDDALYTPPEEKIDTFEKKEIIDAPGQGVIEEVIKEKTEVSDRVDPNFSGAVGEADDAAAFLNEYAANQGKDDLFEPVDSILAGDDAVKAYEDRIGVSPFVALAGKYEQEIGENIAEAKKQSIGKMLFNFGSELTKSGRLGDAAVAAGRDIDKDMDRLITLKREQRKVGFDIAKIGEAERQTKGKIGMTAEQQAKKDNLTKSLKKREFELIEEKNAIDSIYKGKMGDAALLNAESAGSYYKGLASNTSAETQIRAAVNDEVFGTKDSAERERYSKAKAKVIRAQIANPKIKDMNEILKLALPGDEAGKEMYLDYTDRIKDEMVIQRDNYKPSFPPGTRPPAGADPLGLRNK